MSSCCFDILLRAMPLQVQLEGQLLGLPGQYDIPEEWDTFTPMLVVRQMLFALPDTPGVDVAWPCPPIPPTPVLAASFSVPPEVLDSGFELSIAVHATPRSSPSVTIIEIRCDMPRRQQSSCQQPISREIRPGALILCHKCAIRTRVMAQPPA